MGGHESGRAKKAKSLAGCPSFPKERRREASVEEGGPWRCSVRQRESAYSYRSCDDSGGLAVVASAARRGAWRHGAVVTYALRGP